MPSTVFLSLLHKIGEFLSHVLIGVKKKEWEEKLKEEVARWAERCTHFCTTIKPSSGNLRSVLCRTFRRRGATARTRRQLQRQSTPERRKECSSDYLIAGGCPDNLEFPISKRESKKAKKTNGHRLNLEEQCHFHDIRCNSGPVPTNGSAFVNCEEARQPPHLLRIDTLPRRFLKERERGNFL